MDMMEVRRQMMGVIAQMASGARFVKGTFTVPNDDTTSYTIRFGQSFDKYMFFIEMTDDSKTALLNTNINSNRMYATWGISFNPMISEYSYSYRDMVHRINPSTKGTSYTDANPSSTTSSYLSFNSRDITYDSSSVLYRGYSYNYYVVEIK